MSIYQKSADIIEENHESLSSSKKTPEINIIKSNTFQNSSGGEKESNIIKKRLTIVNNQIKWLNKIKNTLEIQLKKNITADLNKPC